MPKQIYTWGKVQTGDIISFRYNANLQTVLVLNTKIPFKKKDGDKSLHLVGLKLEERGTVPTIRNKPALVQILETIGEIKVVSGDDEIYRVEISGATRLGVRKNVYQKIRNKIKRFSVYRTYDYNQARKSQVFLEPILLPKNIKEVLIEN
mgnify:FL=1|tara:strand:- start:2092 stop:2541 length:450 start_codon:yes stop_codon:yes gene_type:complete